MDSKTRQYITGYIIGGSLVLIVIPYGLYSASRSLDHLIDMQLIPSPGLRLAMAAILALIGLIFGIWSNVVLNTVGQGGPLEGVNIEVSPRTQKLVMTGPYQYSRNPMLFGACLFYYAIGVYLNSLIAVAIVTVFMIFMLIFVKLTEEQRLRKDFSSDYEKYRRRVSMFIPWRPKRPKST